MGKKSADAIKREIDRFISTIVRLNRRAGNAPEKELAFIHKHLRKALKGIRRNAGRKTAAKRSPGKKTVAKKPAISRTGESAPGTQKKSLSSPQ
jgi:hypothetical protein